MIPICDEYMWEDLLCVCVYTYTSNYFHPQGRKSPQNRIVACYRRGSTLRKKRWRESLSAIRLDVLFCIKLRKRNIFISLVLHTCSGNTSLPFMFCQSIKTVWFGVGGGRNEWMNKQMQNSTPKSIPKAFRSYRCLYLSLWQESTQWNVRWVCFFIGFALLLFAGGIVWLFFYFRLFGRV